MVKKSNQKNESQSADQSRSVCAVIDVGSTSIRMIIAHVEQNGKLSVIDSLQQAVSLGKDTFSRGFIGKESIDACVKTLKSYRRMLKEYNVEKETCIRTIATSAVREAANRDAFIDRIYIATGFYIEIIDEIDIARLTYLSIKSCRDNHKFEWGENLLIAEISGGSTEVLHLEQNKVILSHNYRLGSLRIREALGEIPAPLSRHRDLMENDIIRTVKQIAGSIENNTKLSFITLGGDIRLAASEINPSWNSDDPLKVPVVHLLKFINDIFSMTIEDVVHRYHLSFYDAETLGPALLFYYHLASQLKLKSLIVTGISLRHGALIEMSLHGSLSKDFVQQVVNSAFETGRKFQFDESHAVRVSKLALILYNALAKEHGLSSIAELHLHIASLLHDIGSFINTRSHHKHSMYIIQHSELFGLSKKDLTIISLIARYHRHASPKPEHDVYNQLSRDQRLTIVKLAAILRIADALDQSDTRHLNSIECDLSQDDLIIYLTGIDDVSLAQYNIKGKGSMFEDVFGLNIILRKKVIPESQ